MIDQRRRCIRVCPVRFFSFVRGVPVLVPVRASPVPSVKERKKTDTPRAGWEDGTPPPHRDF